jgi:hypothetical protein
MSAIGRRIKKVEQSLSQKELLDFGYNFFKDNTPIASGNARRSTKKEGTDTIHADYAYALRLNNGWSKQAPEGMAKPMFKEIQKYLKGI